MYNNIITDSRASNFKYVLYHSIFQLSILWLLFAIYQIDASYASIDKWRHNNLTDTTEMIGSNESIIPKRDSAVPS